MESAKVITDRDSDRSRGFGFVEMSKQEEAEKPIASPQWYAARGQESHGEHLTSAGGSSLRKLRLKDSRELK